MQFEQKKLKNIYWIINRINLYNILILQKLFWIMTKNEWIKWVTITFEMWIMDHIQCRNKIKVIMMLTAYISPQQYISN